MLMLVCEYVTLVFNVFEWSVFMKKNSYDMMLQVFDKQRNGDRLFGAEIRWKRRYNKSREESVTDMDGVKVTRYKPAWIASKIVK
jgi:hypothetical protein